jgi:CheY-like chemotaxis protein
MPHIDGYEATRHIRAHHAPLPGPPIIAVTAQAIEDDRNLCLTSGMNDYLSKPYRPQELKDMIEKWLSPALWPNQEQETEMVMAEGGA